MCLCEGVMCAYVRVCVCSGDDVYKCAGGLDVHVRCLSVDVSVPVYMCLCADVGVPTCRKVRV